MALWGISGLVTVGAGAVMCILCNSFRMKHGWKVNADGSLARGVGYVATLAIHLLKIFQE
jgi:hypothetical protein